MTHTKKAIRAQLVENAVSRIGALEIVVTQHTRLSAGYWPVSVYKNNAVLWQGALNYAVDVIYRQVNNNAA
jgi:hypothetical protein